MVNKKNWIIAVLLVFFVAGGVFSEENVSVGKAENWVSAELSLIGIGVRYERPMTQNFSIGANVFTNRMGGTRDDIRREISIGINARYYPFAGRDPRFNGLRGLYGELGFGFINIAEHRRDELVNSANGLIVGPSIGWKIDFGYHAGFFINPWLSIPGLIVGELEFGGRTSFRVLGFGIGWAF